MVHWRTTKITTRRGTHSVKRKEHRLLIARRKIHTHQKTDGRGHRRYVRVKDK